MCYITIEFGHFCSWMRTNIKVRCMPVLTSSETAEVAEAAAIAAAKKNT